MLIPSEMNMGGVFFPPLLPAGFLGLVFTFLLTRLMNRYRLSRFFASPPTAFFSFVIIFTVIFDVVLFG
jgi:hypothetical protein